jgi:pantoate--beta-alanine ligase
MIGVLREVPALKVEYVSLADAESLEEPVQLQGQILVAVAAHLGPARLIDNLLIDVPDQ